LAKSLLDRVFSGEFWRAARDYMSVGRRNQRERIADPAALQAFLGTRASFIAQSSLYGYLKTRAGVNFPKLFENDAFTASTNIAKWNIWLACLADLAVWAGGLVAARTRASQADIARMMNAIVGAILAGRFGGDEFLVLAGVRDAAGAHILAGHLLQAVRDCAERCAGAQPLSASIGYSLSPNDATQPLRLLQLADTAMYAAKRGGKNRVLHCAAMG